MRLSGSTLLLGAFAASGFLVLVMGFLFFVLGTNLRIKNTLNKPSALPSEQGHLKPDCGVVGPFTELINAASDQYNLPASTIAAVIERESGGTSPAEGSESKGQGLMGLKPEVFSEARRTELEITGSQDGQVRTVTAARDLAGEDLPDSITDPAANIYAGTHHLTTQLLRFGNLKLALAAYHTTPDNPYVVKGDIPPTQDTEQYVEAILTQLGPKYEQCLEDFTTTVASSEHGAEIARRAREALDSPSVCYLPTDPSNACAAFTSAMINPVSGTHLGNFAPAHWKGAEGNSGKVITRIGDLQPGDEVFWTDNRVGKGIAAFDGDPLAGYKQGEHVPMHVGIYLGEYQGIGRNGQTVTLHHAVANNSGGEGKIVVDDVDQHAQSSYFFMGAKRY